MAVSVSCESCEYHFLIDGEHRGERIRCPSCGDPVYVGGLSSRDCTATKTRSASRKRRLAAQQASRKSSVVVVGVAAGLIVLGLIWFVLFPMQGSESTTSESNATTEGP
ncbi:MAG: hypothetical protein ABGZ35_05960 [Planctomycetaceae bacterium]